MRGAMEALEDPKREDQNHTLYLKEILILLVNLAHPQTKHFYTDFQVIEIPFIQIRMLLKLQVFQNQYFMDYALMEQPVNQSFKMSVIMTAH